MGLSDVEMNIPENNLAPPEPRSSIGVVATSLIRGQMRLNERSREMGREAGSAGIYETGGMKALRLQVLTATQILDGRPLKFLLSSRTLATVWFGLG
jgi:hypothetical protein